MPYEVDREGSKNMQWAAFEKPADDDPGEKEIGQKVLKP